MSVKRQEPSCAKSAERMIDSGHGNLNGHGCPKSMIYLGGMKRPIYFYLGRPRIQLPF
jgi:hypothetical protein